MASEEREEEFDLFTYRNSRNDRMERKLRTSPITLHSINTRGSQNLNIVLSRVKSNSGKRSFKFMAISDWNLLDNEIKNAPSVEAFKHRYKFKVFTELSRSL
jgi:hypothetical protein